MPVCTIGYKADDDWRQLAAALINDLPDIIVEVMNTCAGMRLRRNDMTIRLAAFDPADYNVPDLEVAVMTGRGVNDRTYNARGRVRDLLMIKILEWLNEHKKLRNQVGMGNIDVDLRFADMCGVNFDTITGRVHSQWGAPTS